jgi:phosphate:Na+ symporter
MRASTALENPAGRNSPPCIGPDSPLLEQSGKGNAAMWINIAGFLGGMGLFFVGLKLTAEGGKKIAGRRFRNLFLGCTKRVSTAAAVGIAAGFIFQSSSCISVILASLIDSGVTTFRRALPVLLGTNIGLTCLVLLAVVDIKVVVLLLLGISGLIMFFERPFKLVHVASIAFGVAMLLFGLQTVRNGTAPLAQEAWFQAFFAHQGDVLPVLFGVGTLASIILHSVNGVVILAITMAASKCITSQAALALLFGSLLGSSILNYGYASGFTGERRRLAMSQVLFNCVGLALFLPLFTLEVVGGFPVLLGVASQAFPALADQLAAISITFVTVTSTVLLLFNGPYSRLLTRICPDATSGLESLRYARELAEASPDAGLLLINQEQGRIMRHLSTYTAVLRQDDQAKVRQTPQAIHQSVLEFSRMIENCLLDMVSRGQAGGNATGISLLQANQAAIRATDDTLLQLVEELGCQARSDSLERLRTMFLETLDLLLLQAGDVFCHADEMAWELFLPLVSDKGPAMERLRSRYLHEQHTLTPDEQWRLMHMTGLYERCSWLLHSLSEQQRRFIADSGQKTASLSCEASLAPLYQSSL